MCYSVYVQYIVYMVYNCVYYCMLYVYIHDSPFGPEGVETVAL
jgi:hypothetical protein